MVEIVPPNPDFVEMMKEILAQNRAIIEANSALIKAISFPPLMVTRPSPEDKGDKE